MNERKCPHCQTWNKGTGAICSACGGLMDKNEVLHQERKRKGLVMPKKTESELFEIKPHYPWFYKVILHIIRPIFWGFMGIVSFVVWFISWVVA